MITYFGILKDEIYYSRIKKELTDAGVVILNYYPQLKVVKFESEKVISEINFKFFESIEEEKDDFSIEL